MPTAYPFPHVARIALSFLVSVKRVDSVPRIVEVQPWERAEISPSPYSGSFLTSQSPRCTDWI